MDSFSQGMANLLLLADILEVADARNRAAGAPTYTQRDHLHDCGTPACALAHWYAHKGSTWLDADVNEVLEEFALTPQESMELFSGRGCGNAGTAQAAAEYIRRFVARRAAQEAQDFGIAIPRSITPRIRARIREARLLRQASLR